MSTSSPSVPVAMVLGACLSVQVGATLAARLFPVAGTSGATLLRLAVAAAVLLVLVRPRVRGWRRTEWRAVAALGLSLGAMNATFYAALDRIPLGVAVTVEFLGPLGLAAVLSRRARELVWVGVALAGVALLGVGESAVGGLDPVGVALALLAGGWWAAYILAARRTAGAVPGQGGLAVATALGAVLVLPLGARGAVDALADPGLIPVVLGVGLLASVVPYSLELAALRRMSTAAFGVLLSLEPAVAALAGALLLGQDLPPAGVVGVLVVVAASAGSTLCAPRPPSSPVRADAPPATVGAPAVTAAVAPA